jgi:hypothetical protein
MLIVEHQLKNIESCQAMTVQVAGPAPATHLFICSGYILVNAAHVKERTGFVNMMPDHPLPFSFILPNNDRQFLSLTASNGAPLTILSFTASATFPMIHLNQAVSPLHREIKAVQVQQRGPHAELVIYLYVSGEDSEVAITYQASILASPITR